MPRRAPALALIVWSALAAAPSRAGDLGALRDGFETPEPSWRQEQTDAEVRLLAHDRTDRAAREGRASERFQFQAGAGSSFYYSYPLPRVPVVDDLRVSLFVRSDRTGMQLLARVVLPEDVDPDEPGRPTFVTIEGTTYQAAERWRRLEITDFRAAIEEQARVLRATTNRPVKLDGAYVERLVINLYGGPGETEVFLDDLEVSPVPAESGPAEPDGLPAGPDTGRADPTDPDAEGPPTGAEPAVRRPVELVRNRLKKNGQDWFFTAIDAPGADPAALVAAGFDVLEVDLDEDPELLARARTAGMLLMPRLEAPPGDPDGPFDADRALAAAAAFPARDAVAFWNLGDRLGQERTLEARQAGRDRVREILSAFRRDRSGAPNLSAGFAVGDIPDFARSPKNLDLLGAMHAGWGTAEDPIWAQRALTIRRDLAARGNAEQLFWARIDATPHATARRSIWGDDPPPADADPRVQPEQIRLFTYMALMTGFRGLSFRADADLTRPAGRDLLLEMALLNAEIDLFEPLLAQGSEPVELQSAVLPEPIQTPQSLSGGGLGGRRPPRLPEMPAHPTIKFVGLKTRDRRGALMVVADLCVDGQFQPTQMAMNDLKLTVRCQESAQAWEVTPGGVRSLARERIPGGIRLTLPVFDSTALVLVTTDFALVQQVEEIIARIRPRAVAFAIEQAQLRLRTVTATHRELVLRGEPGKDADDLLAKAEDSIKLARERLEEFDYVTAWGHARGALRPLRVLMRIHYDRAYLEFTRALKARRGDPDDRAVRAAKLAKKPIKLRPPFLLVNPVCCPPLISYETLPQAWTWIETVRTGAFGANQVATGDFEDPEALRSGGWSEVGHAQDGTTTSVQSAPGGVGGSRAIRLAVGAADDVAIDDLPPILDHPAAAVLSPPVKVKAMEFVRIAVKVRLPRIVTPGGLGVVVRDSIGGEPLQYHSFGPFREWHEVVMFRRAPADGELTVLLGLGGYGEVFFDDLHIEKFEGPSDGTTPPTAPIPAPGPGDEIAGSRPAAGPPRAPEPNPAAALPRDARPRR